MFGLLMGALLALGGSAAVGVVLYRLARRERGGHDPRQGPR